MKAFTISALAVLTSMVSAAPAVTTSLAVPTAAAIPSSSGSIAITFIGAADAQFTQSFSTEGFSYPIYNTLSVSKISNPGGATCYFYGQDLKRAATVPSGLTVDVGPPQQLLYGYCYAS
ncbi:MAG: hypothetical protein HETSPECPRED_003635 [Heterodermia speciosa]|uniref:Uncharacterized protein n=1 Tax=Heterodermia speciosa TaxID=116794 RepID=A0A8H3PIG5_9LECA|nr:MAG: hypothetical protein HETSPECPRED_003635 [Heterodermia speciosa]